MKCVRAVLAICILFNLIRSIALVAASNYPVANWHLLQVLFFMKLYTWYFGVRVK